MQHHSSSPRELKHWPFSKSPSLYGRFFKYFRGGSPISTTYPNIISSLVTTCILVLPFTLPLTATNLECLPASTFSFRAQVLLLLRQTPNSHQIELSKPILI